MALRLIESHFLSLQYWVFCSVLFWLLPLLRLQLETYLDRWEPISTRAWKKEKIMNQTATLLLRAVFVQWIVLFKCVKQMFYHVPPTTPKQLVSIFSTSNCLISWHSFNKSERMHFFEHSTSFQRPTYSSPPYLFSLLLYFIFAGPH